MELLHQTNLNKLREQAAQFGGMEPIHLSNQIDREARIVEEIEAERKELEAQESTGSNQ